VFDHGAALGAVAAEQSVWWGVPWGKVRTEQGLLRRLRSMITRPATAACAGVPTPPGFLVAAHIKRRSVCSND